MNQTELTDELLRLHRGFGAEDSLTPQRLQALSDALIHHPVGVLRDAVTAALRDPKLPWFDKLSELVEREAEADRKAESRRMDEDAKRFLSPVPPQAKTEWGRAHHRAITLLLEGKREEAQELLKSIGSRADLAQSVPLDGGEWLRANGAMFGLKA